MGSKFPSHQLSNGLIVSGRPEQPKEKPPTMNSTAIPYTGGDIKKSGELGKMFEVHAELTKSKKSGPIPGAPSRTTSGSAIPSSSGRTSGPLNKHGEPIKRSSGPQSGPIPPILPTTGLITSGPITSGPINSTGVSRKVSGVLDSTGSHKTHAPSYVHNQAVSNLSQEKDYSFKKSLSKMIVWCVSLLFVMGFVFGGFMLAAAHNAILLIIVIILFGAVVALFTWNYCLGRRGAIGFIAKYSDTELATAKDGQLVKVSGVVTCGNVPLETSFQQVPRCVYTSTSLYEYRGWDSKAANPKHRHFTWGLRSKERHVADFYISDFQSGLRALVKTGYGAKVTAYVDESVVVDINPNNKDMFPNFLEWLGQKNLSYDDRIMRLKEGYIKEGSTVSVMGMIQRNNNVVMIIPPSEPMSIGCQWAKCIIPTKVEGIVLICEDSSKLEAIPV